MIKYISEKQTNFLKKLVTERASILGIASDETSVIDFIGSCNLFTTKDASEMISKLLAVPAPKVAVPAEKVIVARDISHTDSVVQSVTRIITNKFSKECSLCGNDVETGQGIAVCDGNVWRTFHNINECPDAKEGSPLHLQIEQFVQDNCVGMGNVYFALPSHTGNNDLDFYALVQSHRKTGTVMVLRRVLGGRTLESSPVVRKSEAERVLNALRAMSTKESDEAMKRFADELGRCCLCGRTLTDEASRARGMGADCAEINALELSLKVL